MSKHTYWYPINYASLIDVHRR